MYEVLNVITDDEIGSGLRRGQVDVHTVHSVCLQDTVFLQDDSRCSLCFFFRSVPTACLHVNIICMVHCN
jgi:hypothetical protein